MKLSKSNTSHQDMSNNYKVTLYTVRTLHSKPHT